MPHKHTRLRYGTDGSYNLPPTTIAKPLPVRNNGKPQDGSAQRNKLKRKEPASESYRGDDTPRAFSRLMRFKDNKKLPSGLDNGEQSKHKKRRIGQDAPAPRPETALPQIVDVPTILPGERMADFAARVDQAMPVGGLARKGKDGARRTKTEKRLQKMYAEWRKEDARRKEKLEEEQELAEEEEDERDAALGGEATRSRLLQSMGGKRKVIGEQDEEDDPWEVLKATRDKPKGLHDVALAPPTFKNIPKEKFKVRNGAKVQVADVPNAAGSLKRREELGEARKSIIEQYRQMMGKGSSL